MFRIRAALGIALVASVAALSPCRASPYIRQHRWILLGPMQSSGDCWGEIGGSVDPLPGHDILTECPRAGDDWGGGLLPFCAGAATTWFDLRNAPQATIIDLQTVLTSLQPRPSIQKAKAAAVTYVVNQTGAPAPVLVCTGTYNDSVKVWVNGDLVTDFISCYVDGNEKPCLDFAPATLVPGKNKITAISYNGTGEFYWYSWVGLQHADGTPIDDELDPFFVFTPSPSDCQAALPAVTRHVEPLCTGADALISLRGDGQGDPAGLVQVVENVDGPASVGAISNGGVFTPGSPSTPCMPAGASAGIFTSTFDIGGPCFHGSTTVDAGSYSLTGGGQDIWDEGDQFHFAARKVRGDFSISARVASRPYDDPGEPNAPSRWGKFGLMARQDCGARSRHTSIFDFTEDSNGLDLDSYSVQGKRVHNARFTSFGIPGGAGGIQHPNYLRLDREGNRFIGHASMDGVTWTNAGEEDWGEGAPCEILVGLAVCSRASCAPLSIQFDSIQLAGGDQPCGGQIAWNVSPATLEAGFSYHIENGTGSPTPVRIWGSHPYGSIHGERVLELGRNVLGAVGAHSLQPLDIGGATGGSTTYDAAAALYTLVSSGDNIGDSGDRFHFAFKKVAGDFDLVVEIFQRIEPPEGAFPWGQVGLMARKSCRSSSKHCHLQTPSAERTAVVPGLVYRYIDGANAVNMKLDQFNSTQFDYGDVAQRPRYLRLTRRGETFYAFVSRDNEQWDTMGADTWHGEDPAEPVLVGFAASSGRGFDGIIRPTTIQFRVLRFDKEVSHRPLSDDGADPGQVDFQDSDFATGVEPHWQAQQRSGGLVPAAVNGRLRLTSEDAPFTASSAFSSRVLDGIDSSIFRFEFDAFLSNAADTFAMEGFTFAVVAGENTTMVGNSGSGLGYEGLGSNLNPANGFFGKNVSRNSFAVEFDFLSDLPEGNSGLGSRSWPGKWHLGIDAGNLTFDSLAQTSLVPDAFVPAGLHCTVEYNRGRVRVWIQSGAGTPRDPAAPPTLEADVLPLSFASDDEKAVFGFTGATGVERMTCEVDNVKVTRIPENDSPEVSQIAVHLDGPPRVGDTILLDGSLSSSGVGDSDPLTSFRWEVLSGPAELVSDASGPLVKIRGTSTDAPIIVALTVDDGAGPPPAALPPLSELDLCTPECPLPGYCVVSVPPKYATSLVVFCPFLPPRPPALANMEATLAEGSARFSWSNPVAYDRILVYDSAGSLFRTLPGNLSSLEVDAGGSDHVRLAFQGVTLELDASPFLDVTARRLQCDRPPPLNGYDRQGELELALYGGRPDASFSRCGAGGGGGSLVTASVGHVATEAGRRLAGIASRSNVFTTGFTLEHDSDKIEIRAYYKKIANDFGVTLRARLRHVYPDDGFTDEAMFPESLVGENIFWHAITYFRADGEIGAPPEHPSDPPPRPCAGRPRIPAGDYLLDLYVVGGDVDRPYYVIQDDGRADELLIAGSPCPPYPRVQVTDLTGIDDLPQVQSIKGTGVYLPSEKGVRSTFRAIGEWIDAAGVFHSIDPDGPGYVPVDFEYRWRIFQSTQPLEHTTLTNALELTLASWSCYKVEVTVFSRDCGLGRTRAQEVLLEPRGGITCDLPYNSFVFVAPDPGGTQAIVGLTSLPPQNGKLASKRRFTATILVSPKCACDGTPLSKCPAPRLSDLEFRFAYRLTPTTTATLFQFGMDTTDDLCLQTDNGPKYFKLHLDDLGALPPLALNNGLKFQTVRLQGRTISRRDATGVTHPVIDDAWHDIGGPARFVNPPEALKSNHWSGSYQEEDRSYSVLLQQTSDATTYFPIGASTELPLSLGPLGDLLDLKIPSFPNDISAGLNSALRLQGESWAADQASGVVAGQVMGNQLDGAPVELPGKEELVDAIPRYSWSYEQTIVDSNLEQTLFDAVLFTGLIGPIPVTINATIGLGLGIKMCALASVDISPFAPAEEIVNGRPTGRTQFAKSDFDLVSKLEVSIPCSVRATVLFGIASVALRFIPAASADFQAHLGNRDLVFESGVALRVALNLYLEIKACLFEFLCISTGRIDILGGARNLIDQSLGDPFDEKSCSPPEGGGNGGGVVFKLEYPATSAPATVTSPDGKTTLDTWIGDDGVGKVFVNGGFPRPPTDGHLGALGSFRDPAAAFLSNDKGIIVWTKSFGDETGITTPPDRLTTPEQNLLQSQDEIVVTPVRLDGIWVLGDLARVADVPAEVPSLSNRRADGLPSVAADPTREEAIVAWVRYETPDFLVQDAATPRKRLTVPKEQSDTGCDGKDFCEIEVPNIRPQLEKTAIYTRRVGIAGPVGGLVRISPPGINVEPRIAFSPTGNVAYCVWVHDPTHLNLIDTNRGRVLLYSVYTNAAGTWSAPRPVFANADDSPGTLEPAIALKADGRGLVAFTALDAGAPAIDTGLGGASRYLYTCRLENGAFAAPVRIHGKCSQRIYGDWVTIIPFHEELIDPKTLLNLPQPDWVMAWQGRGPVGDVAGSGNVMVAAIPQGSSESTPPVALTNDDNIHSNVAASVSGGTLHTVSLNGGLARSGIGGGAGGGVSPSGYEVIEASIEPDLSLAGCSLSEQFPGPGAFVHAIVDVENLGLAGTPTDDLGRSVTGVRIVFVSPGGATRVVATKPLPVIPPGGRHEVPFTIEMPLDPVGLRAEVSPNPVDRDPLNDSKLCFLGAPAPLGLQCEVLRPADEDARLSMRLTWTNPVPYDEVLLYRDGALLATVPGACRSFVDIEAKPGDHAYEARGRVGASKSVRAASPRCRVTEPKPRFLRTDSNGDGLVNISDAITTLSYLFTGGKKPPCLEAADADDSGSLVITDGIFTLNFLFLGGRSPPAPHPGCGEDPTADVLGCETSCGS